MAKSIRSKSVRRNRNLKRASVYQPVLDARLKRLCADRLEKSNTMLSSSSTSSSCEARFNDKKYELYGLSRKETQF